VARPLTLPISASGRSLPASCRLALENGGLRLCCRSAGIESGDISPHSTILPVLERAAFHRAPARKQGGVWSAARRRRFGFPAERGDRPTAPVSTALPQMEAFASVAAPLALKAVTSHRTPQSSPFWSGPLFTVRQPGNRQEYGVRRDVAALAFPLSGETGPPPRSARRSLRMWAEVSGMRRGGTRVRWRGSPSPHLNGYLLRQMLRWWAPPTSDDQPLALAQGLIV